MKKIIFLTVLLITLTSFSACNKVDDSKADSLQSSQNDSKESSEYTDEQKSELANSSFKLTSYFKNYTTISYTEANEIKFTGESKINDKDCYTFKLIIKDSGTEITYLKLASVIGEDKFLYSYPYEESYKDIDFTKEIVIADDFDEIQEIFLQAYELTDETKVTITFSKMGIIENVPCDIYNVVGESNNIFGTMYSVARIKDGSGYYYKDFAEENYTKYTPKEATN